MSILRGAGLLISVAILAACATPARVEQMIAKPSAAVAEKNSHLKNHVGLGLVAGGEETSPLWVSNVSNADFVRSLEGSLRAANLLASNRDETQFLLGANLNALQQPFMGFDMTVTASVSYTLTSSSTGKEVFRETLATPFTATVSDAFLGVERLKLANEGAVKANVTSLIEKLYSLKPDGASKEPRKSKEARLSELKALYDKGLISKQVVSEEENRIVSE